MQIATMGMADTDLYVKGSHGFSPFLFKLRPG